MIKVFIIEDEKHIQEELKLLLKRYENVSVVGACTSVAKALQVLPVLDLDLVLMDIQLDDGKSFEIVEKLGVIDFEIVFLTAYDEYAIRAIKIGAMDYLLKPVNEEELYNVLAVFDKRKKQALTKEQTQLILQNYDDPKELKKIVVRTMHEIFFIEIGQIYFCKGDGNYTTFYLENDKRITSSRPLREYAALLPNDTFIKTHQSYIVNKNFVNCYKHSHEIIMHDNTVVPVSMRHKDNVIEQLSNL
ncbi:MAG: DNA-binding response regulator [Bacteroidetes bacterium]|nr:MAG: DNA-binding response regulator [Bacteroidota bacterium]